MAEIRRFVAQLTGEAAEVAGRTGGMRMCTDGREERVGRLRGGQGGLSGWPGGEENQTDAIGEGLAAVADALLDAAYAIRKHTEASR